MSWTDGTVPRGISTRAIITGAIGVLLLMAAIGFGAASAAWQANLAAEGRVLPGTTIAGFHLGERTVEEARPHVEALAAELLTRPVALTHGEQRWELAAVDLDGTAAVDAALAAALDATRDAPLHRAIAARWWGARTGAAVTLPVTLDEPGLDAFLEEAVRVVERAPSDATITLEGGSPVVVPAQVGYTVDRWASRQALLEGLRGTGGTSVALAARELPYDVATAEIESLVAAIGTTVEELLARPVVVRHGDLEWTVTASDVGGTLDLDPLIAAHVAASRAAGATADTQPVATSVAAGTDLPPLSLELGDGVESFVAQLAEEIDAPVVDAALDHSSGWVELVRDQLGQQLDRRAAVALLADALRDGGDRIDLPVEVTEPEVTADAFSHVLLVRLDQRRLYLYEDGEVVRDWRVATGAPGYNTPAGRFVVGLKRAAPTWHNPAPNGWGADMPLVVEPGPNNPLGLRALNWDREDGSQTLIRFHGTSNLNSIGTAASKGCIRLANGDIVELFDLVPEGATIISTWG